MSLHSNLAKIMKNSYLLHWLYNSYHLFINKRSFMKEIERRSHYSIFDYEQLAQPMPFCPIEKIADSNYYGHAYSIKQYCGCKSISSGIEHGIYLGNRVTSAERLKTTKSVIAMSQNRVDSFTENGINKPVLPIGPYIHYAKLPISHEEFRELKKRLGRVLLVFPFHSTVSSIEKYDSNSLMDIIEKKRKDYDTVLVCLHHNDVMNPRHYIEEYKNKGYKIVCAGHKFDFNFLGRLKLIISLADFVIENGIGTQVGYCAFLGVPQFIFRDHMSISAVHNTGSNAYDDRTAIIAEQQTNEILDAFGVESGEYISPAQLYVMEKYWGASLIKKPQELLALINRMNNL